MRQGKTGLACTDGQNQWNTGGKRNAGQHKMQDVCFKRHKRQQLHQPSTSQSSSAIPTPAHEARLFKTHEEWRKSALASSLADFFTSPHDSLLQLSFDADTSAQCVDKAPSPSLLPHDEHHTPLACVKCSTFYNKYIKMLTTQIKEIEQSTRAQSKEQLWHDMRRVRITASTAKNVPVRLTTAPDKFLSNHLHPTFHGNAATRHGAESEELARQFLQDQGYSIETKGLVVCPGEPWLAASPDGVINKDMLLEIKSPVIGKNKSLTETLAAGNCEIKPMANGEYYLTCNGPKGYYMQVQLGMNCTGLRHTQLVVWNKTEHLELQVPLNQAFVQEHVARLRTFYFTHMLPKIVDDFVEGRMVLCSKYLNIVKST